MRMSSLRAVAALLFGCATAAAQPPAAPAPDAPRYQVEIIVFANREFDPSEERFPQQASAGGDAFTLREAPVFDDTNFGPLAQPGALPATAPALPPVGAQPAPGVDALATEPLPVEVVEPVFRMLSPDELQLRAEYQRLSRIPAYTPLLHAGWVQAGLPEDRAPQFDLALLGSTNPRGTVRLYLSRFLHVNLDITYQAATNAAEPPPASGGLDEFAVAPRYTLVTERNVRSGELHYFDHPAFGVLVKITPVPTQPGAGTSGRRPAA